MVRFLKYHDGICLDGKPVSIIEYEASGLKFILTIWRIWTDYSTTSLIKWMMYIKSGMEVMPLEATIYFYMFSNSEQYQDDCETEVTLSQWFTNFVKNRITFDWSHLCQNLSKDWLKNRNCFQKSCKTAWKSLFWRPRYNCVTSEWIFMESDCVCAVSRGSFSGTVMELQVPKF